MVLSRIPRHPQPSPGLEQYATPGDIAADVLYRALALGDIQGRRVVDLGAGTGVLAIGAALLGAASVTGVELDAKALSVAEEAAHGLGVRVEWVQGDVESVTMEGDTVVMNPPFGAQFAARGADVRFVEKAIAVAPVVYSLHAHATRTHLQRLARRWGVEVSALTTYRFPLAHQFAFHKKEKVVFEVDLLRFARMG